MPSSALCSHTGLSHLTSARAVHVGIPGTRVPRLVQSRQPGCGQAEAPGPGWPDPPSSLRQGHIPCPQRSSVQGWGRPPSLEAWRPEDLGPAYSPMAGPPPPPLLTLRLLPEGGGSGEGQVIPPAPRGAVTAAGKATQQPSAVLQGSGPAERGPVFAFLSSAFALPPEPGSLFAQDLPSGEMGGAGPGWQAGGPLLWGFQLVRRRAGLPVSATPVVPPAAPAVPGCAHAGRVTAAPARRAWHARAAVAAAAGWPAGAWSPRSLC